MQEREELTGNVDQYRAELQKVADDFEDVCQKINGPSIAQARSASQMLQAACERVLVTYLITSRELDELVDDLSEEEYQKLIEIAAVDYAQSILSSSAETATGAIYNRYNNMILKAREAAREGEAND
jgi:hypothetical protein